MEDEEFYHLMTADLERLYRVHHHIDPLPTTTNTPRRNSLPAALAAAALPPVVWMSHLTDEFKEAMQYGVEMVGVKVVEGRRRSLGLVHAVRVAAVYQGG